MRTPVGEVVRLPWFALAGLFLVACSPAVSLAGLSGAAVPLAVASVVLTALGCILAASCDDRPDVAAAVASREGLFQTRDPARQCDPDAAGHARPRAPGWRINLGCC
jgi:hypothetical protein